MKSRPVWGARLVAVLASGVALACGSEPREDVSRPLPAATAASPVAVSLTLTSLVCLDKNDGGRFDDELFVVVAWDGTESGHRQLPEAGGRWRMCGRSEFEPSPLVDIALEAGQTLSVSVEIIEDDSQAERVSNQIDDTLVRFDLTMGVNERGRLRVRAAPHPVQDNNAVGLLPPTVVELDETSRQLTFGTEYQNADGDVRYRGQIAW